MTSPTVELETRLAVEKEALKASVDRLRNRAHDVADWRRHIRRHPAQALGAAAVVGLVVGVATAKAARKNGTHRDGKAQSRRAPAGDGAPGRAAGGEGWHRVKSRLVDMVVERAIDAVDVVLDRVAPRPRAKR